LFSGWVFAPDPTGELTALQTLVKGEGGGKEGKGKRRKEQEGGEGKGGKVVSS